MHFRVQFRLKLFINANNCMHYLLFAILLLNVINNLLSIDGVVDSIKRWYYR